MKILNIGSLNLDHVYYVDHLVLPGETESAYERKSFAGGKGLNQSIALAKAGAEVYHCGLIGSGGRLLLETCKQYGVHTDYIQELDAPNGHAVIQVDKDARNSILLFGGTNQMFTEAFVDRVLADFGAGDPLLLQNEINLLPYIVDQASARGMKIIMNPSPYNKKLAAVDLRKISLFLLNEVEGSQLTGKTQPDQILNDLQQRFPSARVVLTLGEEGAIFANGERRIRQSAFPVRAVDTTAAGDTFTGYYIAHWMLGLPEEEVLRISAKAASIAVTREGAADSIPDREEVISALFARS